MNFSEKGIKIIKINVLISTYNGQPTYLVVDYNRFTAHKRNIYDINWNYLDIDSDHDNFGDILEKPKNFEKMIDIARILSKSFPFVRVDLYNIDGIIKFGELTFYPWSGYIPFQPDEFDFELLIYIKMR